MCCNIGFRMGELVRVVSAERFGRKGRSRVASVCACVCASLPRAQARTNYFFTVLQGEIEQTALGDVYPARSPVKATKLGLLFLSNFS